jgi:hypothetical protein
MMVKYHQQLVNFVKQVAVIKCEGYEKHGKGDVLFPEFSKHIAHGFGHEGKRSDSIDLIFFRACVQISIFVIAAKVKVFGTAPLNDNFKGFNIAHGRFNFMIISRSMNDRFSCDYIHMDDNRDESGETSHSI